MSVRPSRMLLELDLTQPLFDADPQDPLQRLLSRNRTPLSSVLRALHRAGSDSRVVGLIAKVGGPLPWTVAEELSLGISAFRASGKPTLAWSEDLGGEAVGRTSSYVLACAFDEIWLQPGGWLGPLGVGIESTFLRKALDRLDLEPQLSQRHEYKNAANTFTRTEYTPAHREAVAALVGSVHSRAAEAIAAGRDMPAERVRQLMQTGGLSAAEALSEGLVDATGFRDEAYAAMHAKVGRPCQLVFADRWRPRPSLPSRPHEGRLALIFIRGVIAPGHGRPGPLGRVAGSATLGAALRATARDDRVRSVVIRVDSPGGSAVASETIWREVVRVQEAGKPVIVSMGELAASGGYFVSCSADVIVALPSTITGSIGVLGGKIVIGGLLERLGVTSDRVASDDFALMHSARTPYSEEQREVVERQMDHIYSDFVEKVAAGRGRPASEIEAVARGRVWTGSDALGVGLVDQLGGMRDAVRIARGRGGLKPDSPVVVAGQVPTMRRLGRPHNSEDPRTARVVIPRPADLQLGELALLAPPIRFAG